MNVLELKAELARNDMSAPELAKAIGISKKRMYSRINGVLCFTQKEIADISKVLCLSNERIIEIFFTDKVS